MHLHGAVGVVLLVIAGFGMVEALSRGDLRRVRSVGALCAAGGGVLIVTWVAFNHLRSAAHGERGDAAHWTIGGALFCAGLLTWLGRRGSTAYIATELAMPFAVLGVGALFVVHADRNLVELLLHVAIATSMVFSSLAHLSFVLTGEGRSMRMLGALLLGLAALLLILFDARAQLGERATDH